MASVPNGVETLPKVSIPRVGRTNVTDRQTTERRTDDDISLKMTNTVPLRFVVQVTKILLVVSIVFLICNTPGHVVRAYFFVMSHLNTDYKPGYPIFIAQNILQYLFYANFAANFLLYNASGRTFRRAMMSCCQRSVQRLTTGGCLNRHDSRRRSFADQPVNPVAAAQLPVGTSDTARNRETSPTNLPMIRLPHASCQNG